jgi:hypothetical protein
LNDRPPGWVCNSLKYVSSGFHLKGKYVLANIKASTCLRKFFFPDLGSAHVCQMGSHPERENRFYSGDYETITGF